MPKIPDNQVTDGIPDNQVTDAKIGGIQLSYAQKRIMTVFEISTKFDEKHKYFKKLCLIPWVRSIYFKVKLLYVAKELRKLR